MRCSSWVRRDRDRSPRRGGVIVAIDPPRHEIDDPAEDDGADSQPEKVDVVGVDEAIERIAR